MLLFYYNFLIRKQEEKSKVKFSNLKVRKISENYFYIYGK